MKKQLVGATIGLLSLLVLSACSGQKTMDSSKKDKLEVVTTFYPMYEFTKEVIGDTGTVDLLIPAGTEPHEFEPSAKQVAEISDADVFVYNSGDMEKFVDKMKPSLDTKKTTIIEAAKDISLMEESEEAHDHESEDGHSHELDPHVWLDPVLASQEVQTIADELGEKYPDKKATFEKNAAAYQEKLAALDKKYQAELSNAKNRTFVTQHAAFGYLAKQYHLTQEAIAGISPDQEPSPSRIASLKHFVEEHGTKIIYFEENASSKVAETLSKETGVSLEVLNPLESLTEKQIQAGENYLSVMEQNLKVLKKSIK